MGPSSPRSTSIFSSSAWAITLRHVLAWQTRRTVLATGVRQRQVVRVAARGPRLDHLAELWAHRIDATDRHRAPPDREVMRRKLAGANEVPLGGLRAAPAPQPLPPARIPARLPGLR